MRDFERSSRLSRLPTTARLVYSGFLVYTLAALAVTVWLTDSVVGLRLERVSEYYAGAAPASGPTPRDTTEEAGPTLDLPEDVASTATPAVEPKPLRSVLEVTHFHLFTMPLYWMVLAHLYALARAHRGQAWVITIAGLSVGAHLLAPWFARSALPGAKLYYAASGLCLGVSFLWMAVVALADLWRPTSKART